MYLSCQKKEDFLKNHLSLKRLPTVIHEELGKNCLGGVEVLKVGKLRTRSRWLLSSIVNELVDTELITLNKLILCYVNLTLIF